ncbi:hypothetical protein SDC9_155240 [bioreactor metagenome]|uniref:Uncharacterized protein n=1 Tax=bioreactor metagenome TaxID=1076179 RepID=A0A645F0Z0_9ZZZZ
MGNIVQPEHFLNVLARIKRGVEEEAVQVLIDFDLVLAADQFGGVVGDVGADEFDHAHQFPGRPVGGEVDIFGLAG